MASNRESRYIAVPKLNKDMINILTSVTILALWKKMTFMQFRDIYITPT